MRPPSCEVPTGVRFRDRVHGGSLGLGEGEAVFDGGRWSVWKAEFWPRRSVAEPQGLVRTPACPLEAAAGSGAAGGGAPGRLWSWRPPTRRCIEGPRLGRGLCACKCPPEEPVCGDWF